MSVRETEDLDKYVEAYENSFPFSSDNHGVLTAYAGEFVRSCEKIEGALDICSLGIGYEIVSRTIGQKLEHRINSYTAIEGSKLLIERHGRYAEPNYPFDLVHAYFEDFEAARTPCR